MMNRNEFLKSSVGLATALLGLGLVGACGSDGGSGPPDAKGTANPDGSSSGSDAGADAMVDGNPGVVSCTQNGTSVAISANHGHALVVSKADIAAGVEKTYSIQGTSLHEHSVTLTAAHFAMLTANTTIQVVSTPSVHTHDVTVSCASA